MTTSSPEAKKSVETGNQSYSHSCAGQAKVDNNAMDWMYVAKGTCEKQGGTGHQDGQSHCAEMSIVRMVSPICRLVTTSSPEVTIPKWLYTPESAR